MSGAISQREDTVSDPTAPTADGDVAPTGGDPAAQDDPIPLEPLFE